jgi:hypothetical protein
LIPGLIPGPGPVAWVLWDAFETILLPRRVPGGCGCASLPWLKAIWAGIAPDRTSAETRKPARPLRIAVDPQPLHRVGVRDYRLRADLLGRGLAAGRRPGHGRGFAADLTSGTTFFSHARAGDLHLLAPIPWTHYRDRGGHRFGFLALVIAYVPVLYQAFAARGADHLLDEWAGSPPTAAVLLRRWSESKDPKVLEPLLKDWELAAAEIL